MRDHDGLPGFSYADADGKFSGIDEMFVVVLPRLYSVTIRK